MTRKKKKTIICLTPDGQMKDVATYDDRFAAIYALALFVAQEILHTSYLDKHQMNKIRNQIRVGFSRRTCFFSADDALYSCLSHPGQSVYDGEQSSKFEYTPNLPK